MLALKVLSISDLGPLTIIKVFVIEITYVYICKFMQILQEEKQFKFSNKMMKYLFMFLLVHIGQIKT